MKFLTQPSPDAARRFELEARAMMRIRSPYCVHAIDMGRTPDGERYLVTEFVDGDLLSTWMKRRPSLEAILTVATQIALALAAAHREGLIHRDLKPANVIVQQTQSGPQVRVLDFGLAKLLGREQGDLTKTGEVLGTPGFMSPEQLRGLKSIGPATDLYCLGAVLFEMLDGVPVFSGETSLAIAMQHLADPAPPLRRAVPPRLRALVARLLEKEPSKRSATAAGVADELREILSGSGATALSSAPTTPAVPRRVAVLVGVLVLGLVGAIVVLSGPGEEAPPVVSQRSTSRVAALIAANDVGRPPQRTPEPAALVVDAAGEVDLGRNAAGCEGMTIWEPGTHRFDELTIHIPPGYSPTRTYPVVMLFHDGFQESDPALRNLDFGSIDEGRDYVVIAPLGNAWVTSHHWEDQQVQQHAFRALNRMSVDLCLDRDNIYALGHGKGGNAAYGLACHIPVRAIAVFGHRLTDDCAPRCAPKPPIATLEIFPDHDSVAPAEGGEGCGGGGYRPISAEIARSKKRQSCRGPATSREVAGGTCQTWTCGAPYAACVVDGGRAWPGRPRHFEIGAILRRCRDDGATQFGVTAAIWDFFDEARAAR